jgi:RNA polymerase sigma factor (sigma-70 family)
MYLLARTREGSDEAFAELWRRNLPAAYAVAHRYRGHASAEDVVAEAATRVLALVKEGRGPEENFRAYFLSAVRSVAVDSGRRDLRAVPIPDEDLDGLVGPFAHEVEVDGFDPEIVRAAFRELPERDQRILWHTTVEGETPRVVGPALGMSANAVSVRAMRAREALRAHYLEAYAAQHVPEAPSPECHWAVGVLAAHVRGRLPKRASDRLQEHLDGCAHESGLLAELRTIQDRFPALVVPLLFLAGASTPGFLGGTALAGLGGATAGAGAAGVGAAGAAASDGAPAASTGLGELADPEGAGSLAGELGFEPGLAPGLAPAAGATPAPSPSGASDALSGLAPRAAALAAAAIVAVGVLTSARAGVSDLATGSVVPSASSSTSSSGSSTTAGTSTTSGTPGPTSATTTATTPVATTTVPPTTTVAPTTVPVVAPAPQAPAPAPPRTTTALPPSSTVAGPGIELRVISSGTPTRFSVRFSTETAGSLQVSVANASGTGVLSADNGAFTCANTSASAVSCTGRGGHILLTQSGLSSPGTVTVRVTDSAGGTTTKTLRLG